MQFPALTSILTKTQTGAVALGKSVGSVAQTGASTVVGAAKSVAHGVDTWRSQGAPVNVKTVVSAVREAQALVAPAQNAYQTLKNNTGEVIGSVLPEPFASAQARETVQKGVQTGAKLGGYFGPVGTIVGVSVGALATLGFSYLTYEAAKPVEAKEGTPDTIDDLDATDVIFDGALYGEDNAAPTLHRAATI